MIEPLNQDEKNRLFLTLDAQTRQLDRLERGIFGDKDLKIAGLIRDVDDIKKWRNGLKLKIAFISGAFASAWEGGKWLLDYLGNNHKPGQ